MSDLETYNKQADLCNNPSEYVKWLQNIAKPVRVDHSKRTPESSVAGCSAPVWMGGEMQSDGTFTFWFSCDSVFVNGLGKILMDVYNGKNKDEILAIKFRDFGPISKFLLFERKRSFQKFINKIYSIVLNS